jgi:hypothetical protein
VVRGRQHAVPVFRRQLLDLARGGGNVGFEHEDPGFYPIAGGLLRLGRGERWEECGNEGEAHHGGDGRKGLRSRELGLKGGLGGR